MLESNEVTFVYYNPNPAVLRRTTGGGGYIFLDQDNLEAKAVSTYRQKEGYPEYTNSFLPPSDPPKWYLGREYCSFAEGDGIGLSDNYITTASTPHIITVSNNLTPPVGLWHLPTIFAPAMRMLTTGLQFFHTRHEGWDYSFAEPSECSNILFLYKLLLWLWCTTTYSTGH